MSPKRYEKDVFYDEFCHKGFTPLRVASSLCVAGSDDPRADILTRSQINYIFNLFTCRMVVSLLLLFPSATALIRTIVCESCLSMELAGFVGKLFLLQMIDIR